MQDCGLEKVQAVSTKLWFLSTFSWSVLTQAVQKKRKTMSFWVLFVNLETNYQIAKLQAEMNEFKGLLSTLNHQFISCSEEDNALRASSFRNPESIDMVTRASRTRYTAPMTQNMHDYSNNEYEEQIITPTESLDTKKLLTAINELPRQIQTSSTNTKLLQTNVPYFWGHKDKFNEFEHLILNYFRPFANKITDEAKIHFFQSLPRDEAVEYWQTNTINSMTTMTQVLELFRKWFARKDMKEVEFTRKEPQTQTTEKTKFEGQCFYSGKTDHRKQECRSRLRDENSKTLRRDTIKPQKRTEGKPKYNP